LVEGLFKRDLERVKNLLLEAKWNAIFISETSRPEEALEESVEEKALSRSFFK